MTSSSSNSICVSCSDLRARIGWFVVREDDVPIVADDEAIDRFVSLAC